MTTTAAGQDEAERKRVVREIQESFQGREELWQDATLGKDDEMVSELQRKQAARASSAMSALREAEAELAALKERSEASLEAKQMVADHLKTDLLAFISDTAARAVDSRGKPLPANLLSEFQARTVELETELERERSRNLRLRGILRSQGEELKLKEAARDGLHLIDFEQLKIENQSNAQKIEDRNEEIARLKKKIDSTVQVVTHVKEKLKFVSEETEELRSKLQELEAKVLDARDGLSTCKQERDKLRGVNQKLQQQNGLVGATELLRDYEQTKMALEEAQGKIELLRRAHARVTGHDPNAVTTLTGSVKFPSIVLAGPPSGIQDAFSSSLPPASQSSSDPPPRPELGQESL